MTALYLERYLNFGLTPAELRSGKPIIGIAQTGSDLSPCNRHHLDLAKRVREGIRTAGGVALEFPCHPIQETGKRPTAALDRNLAYLSLVEVLYGYPLDGVVLMTGCDKTTPACLMLEADNFNPWIESAQGYLTHCLNAYDKNPVWTADPKRAPFREAAKRSLTAGGLGSVGEKAATAIADFVVLDMFANYCTGREDVKGSIAQAERQARRIYR